MALHNIRRIIITHVDTDHTGGWRSAASQKARGLPHRAVMERNGASQRLAHLAPLPAGAACARPLPAPCHPTSCWWMGRRSPSFTVGIPRPHARPHLTLHTERRLLIAGCPVNRRNRLSVNISAFTTDPFNARRSLLKLTKNMVTTSTSSSLATECLCSTTAPRGQRAPSQIFSTDV